MDDRHSKDRATLQRRIDVLEAELTGCRRQLQQETQDVAARGQAEEALRESEERFRQLADGLGDAVWIRATGRDGQRRIVYVNPAFEHIFGVSAKDGYGEDAAWQPALHEADRERVLKASDDCAEGRTDGFDEEYRITWPDGRLRWIWARASAVRGADGRPLRVVGLAQDITERKEAAQTLAAERDLLRTLIDHLPVEVFFKDAEGRYVTCNRVFAHLHGAATPGELVGKTTFDTDPADLAERYRADDLEVMRSGTPLLEREEPVIDAAGVTRWHSTTKVLRRDAQGNVAGIIGISRDITERRQAEEALRDGEERFRQLADNLEDAVWIRVPAEGSDNPFPLVYANPAYERVFGVRPQDGNRSEDLWVAVLHPQDRERIVNALTAFLSGEADSYDVEYRIVRDDGSLRWVWARAVPILDAQGRLQRVIGLTQDITERRESAQALAAERNLLRTLIDALPDAIYLKDADGRFVICNAANARLQGAATPDELVGKTTFDTDPPELAKRYRADDLEVMHSGQLLPNREEPIVNAAGDTRWFSTTKVPRRDAQGNVAGIIGISHDITEAKQSEAALRASEQRFRTMADYTYDWEYWRGPDSRLIYVSPSCERITGYRAEEFYQDAGLVERIVHPDDRALFAGHLQAEATEPEVKRLELRILTCNGEERWVGHVCQAVFDDDGTWLGRRVSNRDITDRKRAEQGQVQLQAQLLQSQKMEAIGRLTAGIAHDFNNLLTVINGFAELLKMQLPADERANSYADKIIGAGQRAAGLVGKLMAFSRKQVLQPRVIDLNEVVAGMEAMLHRLIGEDIVLEALPALDIWPVKADPSQIEQVIVNLAVNARDAMPLGGRLTLETLNVTLTAEQPTSGALMPAGDYVRLAVSDTGFGMSEEIQAHLFEPFFTTKPLGQGTGLGLPTVYGIVRQSEGYVQVESAVGRGASVSIYLPRSTGTSPAEDSGRAQPLAPRGAETVLVVEDDGEVRRLACHVLRHQGYQVLEAANARDALRISDDHIGTIHLVLTDVVMPGMSGRELADHMARLRPDTKVILMSGYAGDMIVDRAGHKRWTEFLHKPISALDLARKVRQVLDQGVGSKEQGARSKE